MNAQLKILQQWFGRYAPWANGLAAPLLVITILSMMVLPLAPWVLDTFFTLNIAIALVVMMVAAYMKRPLDFSVFPTVLLLTTLLRLSLNVASTRVVLLEGHTGPGAAGAVIEAFGHFLIGGNFAVGFVVFVILVVINFIVITKGSERIAEVSARFTLDAMPGKQMAIDADLNAGLIDEKEAKRRRAEVGEEAEFFGSMDGASKFVRGDAIAGILILFINIIGGLIIGIVQHGLSAGEAADSYILLAVGDALVAQIPALLISVAAAMVVSRVGTEQNIGAQIGSQVFGSSKALGVTAINQKLYHVPKDSNERHWVIRNPMGQHAIACGLDAPLHVEIHGHVGFYCGGMNKEAEITYTMLNMRDPIIGGNNLDKIALRRAIAMSFNVDEYIIPAQIQA